MVPPPPPAASSSKLNNPHTPYSLALLGEYASTLDTLPIELSRNFADLRELDAVLTASMANISAKVSLLITLIETRQGTPLQRLQLLHQIADEAERVKLGGDDKIKIACQVADNIKNQYNHLTTLLTCLPDFESTMLVKKTTYPHVLPNLFVPPPYESGRRRRAPNSGGLLLGSGDASPHKRRRVVHDEDLDYGAPNRTPRKDREGGQARQRARTKK
jgi:inhibitor of growth protein 3